LLVQCCSILTSKPCKPMQEAKSNQQQPHQLLFALVPFQSMLAMHAGVEDGQQVAPHISLFLR